MIFDVLLMTQGHIGMKKQKKKKKKEEKLERKRGDNHE